MSALVDRFGRSIEYLRLSVTDRCDLRCNYCIPRGYKLFKERSNWLNFDEIERLVRLFSNLGVTRLRLTGGEPLLRKGLSDLCRRLKVLAGLDDLSISTNGTCLSKMAIVLKESGVNRLNVSLDSIRHEVFERITGRAVLDLVLGGLEEARTVGFSLIKVNMVVMRNNADEIDDIVKYCMERGFVLRLIELMPMGATARSVGYVDLQPIKARLRKRFGLVDTVVPGGGPARYLGMPDGGFNVGFITPLSQHFCATCNRVRLTVDGVLYTCLGQDTRVDLGQLMRDGCNDLELADTILKAVNQRPEGHEFISDVTRPVRFMHMTGG
jgi:cyclic pyranopterin phosphate synthase